MNYSLLSEPWVKGEDSAGNPVTSGIRDIFTGESTMVRLQGDSPAQDYAILRLLLAIFWRAHHPETHVSHGDTFDFGMWFEETWLRLKEEKADRCVVEYLAQFEERFDLLHPTMPFMQVADLHTTNDDSKPVGLLMPEINSDYFTMRAGERKQYLTLDEAARWLVYTQAFDFSGIKSGAVGDSRVKGGKGYPIGQGWSGLTGGTVVVGVDLFETFLLNTTASALYGKDDHPVWERIPDGPGARAEHSPTHMWPVSPAEPQGPADLATWQSRRIRLFLDEDNRVSRVLISNGDRIPDAGANILADPMTPYRFSTNKSKKGYDVYYPRPYDSERTVWRSLDALLIAEGDTFEGRGKPPQQPRILTSLAALSSALNEIPQVLDVKLVSLAYGPQAASVTNTVSTSMGIPTALLTSNSAESRNAVRRSALATKNAAVALGSYAGMLLVAAGGEYSFQSSPTDCVLAILEPLFTEWLRNLHANSFDEVIEATAHWEKIVRHHLEDQAKILLRGAGPKALVGVVDATTGSITSAGTCYRQLAGRLNKILPSTTPEKKSHGHTSDRKDGIS